MARYALFTVLLVWSAAACGGSGDHAASPVVRDSAGVTIIENSAAAWGGERRWRLSDQPILSIGEIEGPPEYTFHRVMGVVRLDDGRIAVAEMGSNELHLYDQVGRHLWTAGGTGQGPGESTQVFGLLRGSPDILLVWDALGPIHLFSAAGDYLRSVDPPQGLGPFTPPIASLPDGSLLYLASAPAPVNLTAPTETRATLARRDPLLETVDSVLSLMAGVLHPGWMGQAMPAVFGPTLSTAVTADRLYAGYSDEFAIREYDASGALTRIIRRTWIPVVATQDLVERYTTRWVDGEAGGTVPERLPAQRRSVLDMQPIAETLPAFSALLADRAGNVWVRETDIVHLMPARGFNPVHPVPSHWNVFGVDGTWLGVVETPTNFHIFEIGDDYVAGVAHDDLGVERIHVYELEKDASR